MTDVYISGVSAYLPNSCMTIENAVLEGLYGAERAKIDGFTSILIEEKLSAPEMACKAGKLLINPDDIGRVKNLYLTTIHRHGHKLLWAPANYLQRELGLNSDTRITNITQGCNGGFIAASFSYDLISNGVSGDHLVIGADRYSGSAFNRWTSDLGTIYGDAASAIRFSNQESELRVKYCGLESEPELEEMYRDIATGLEGYNDHTIKEAKTSYLDRKGRDHFNALFNGALRRLRGKVLDMTDLANSPAAYIIYPNVGAGLSASLYSNCFGELANESGWVFGRSVGHTGTSDQFIGLWKLIQDKKLKKGDQVFLLGAGNGLNLGALLVEMV